MRARWWPSALTLAERAAAVRAGDAGWIHAPAEPTATPASAARLQRWRTQRPFDRPDVLERRLLLDRLTHLEFESIIRTPPDGIANKAEAPHWVGEVERTDAIAREIARSPRNHVEADASGLGPVRAFVEPFATAGMSRLYAEARLIVQAHPSAPFDAQNATRLFEPWLWGQLVGRAMKVVILELNVARVQGTLVGATPHERCAHFADQLRAGPVRDQIIEEYPVLARSLVAAAANWSVAAAEFLQHLAADASSLRDSFAEDGELGVLTRLTAGAGDAHREGRSVIIAEFSSGTRVVYKPRSLSVDCHFHEFITWINARGQTPPLRAVRAITAGDHGWAEFVSHRPCLTHEDVGRFYERIGAYLAVLLVVNATDFHYENVIASGEFPMLIDLEALFHPLPESSEAADEPEWLGWTALQASVLRTGVLPFRAYDNEQSSGLDMSAMGGAGGQQTPNRFPVLVAAGTDEMRFEREFIRLPESQNRPALGSDPVSPMGFAWHVIAGFTRTYRLLLASRDELLAPDGPIHGFGDDAIRVVLRPTRQYALILSESHHPDVMRDALERDRLIDRLWVAVPGRPQLEQVVRWEHADVVNGDVPLFTSRPSSHDLFTTHGLVLHDFFPRQGLASAIERIEAMSEDDLRRQQWIVEASLVALRPGHHDSPPANAQPLTATARGRAAAPSPDETIDAAQCVADRLVKLALRSDDRVTWLGLTLVRERDWVIQPVATELYGGSAGIALFLAYLDHIVGHDESRTIVRCIVAQLRRRITATLSGLPPAAQLPPGSLGAFGALGGAVYALAHIGALWSDNKLIDVADHLVSVLRAHVEDDRNLDIIGGTAGFMMAAAALERARAGGSALSALRCGADALVSRADATSAGTAWTTQLASLQPLNGVSHGASGIALALMAAGRLLGDQALVRAATNALRYERATFDAPRMNWPDYRILDDQSRSATPSVMWAWCHGAPGIGLVRLAALGTASDEAILDDLRASLQSTACFGFGSNDSLCHGDLGNLELLLRARELGHRGEWERALATEPARLIPRLRRGAWRCGIPGGVETPGLMTGLAGIGYGLLRLAAPDRVPSVLSLEPPRVSLAPRSDS